MTKWGGEGADERKCQNNIPEGWEGITKTPVEK